MVLIEIIGDLLPAGVLNIVQGFGREAGQALATSTRIAKIAFTGSTPVGSHIMRCAAENIIPSTVELGGKSPNIFFEDIMNAEPAFIEKAAEGLVLASSTGRGLHLPVACADSGIDLRALHGGGDEEGQGDQARQPAGYRHHGWRPGVRAAVRQDPFLHGNRPAGRRADPHRRCSREARRRPGLRLLRAADPDQGSQQDACVPEEIFGPVVGVATFKDEAEALAIANDTEFGLGAGV